MNSAVDFTVFSALIVFLEVHYILAHFFSYLCGMINSYFWNKYWTFQKTDGITTSEVSMFVTVNLISLSISALALYLFREWAHIDTLPGKIIATFLAMMVNFMGNRLWAFRTVHTGSNLPHPPQQVD